MHPEGAKPAGAAAGAAACAGCRCVAASQLWLPVLKLGRVYPASPQNSRCSQGVAARCRPELHFLLATIAGIVSVAVVLKHAAIFPQHEQQVGQLAREMGFQQVRPSRLQFAGGA